MPTTLNPGTGGEVVESVQRSGTEERQVVEVGGVPTFWALTGNILFSSNRYQFVLYNNSASALVQIRLVVWLPASTASVGTPVQPSIFTHRVRISPTTAPSGGAFTIHSFDSSDSLPGSITAHTAPTTDPAGGTVKDLIFHNPQPDEVDNAGVLTPETALTAEMWGGTTIYRNQMLGFGAKPLTLRQNQTYEVQQGATAGTGSVYRIFCVFTII